MEKKIQLLIMRIIIVLGVFLFSGYGLKIIVNLNILPFKYFIPIAVVILLLNVGAGICLFKKKMWINILSGLLYFVLIILSGVIIEYGGTTLRFLNQSFNNITMEISDYNILLLQDEKYESLEDLKDKKIGYITTDTNAEEAVETVSKQVTVEWITYTDIFDLYQDYLDKKLDAILLEISYLEILEEDYDDVLSTSKVVYSFSIIKDIEKVDSPVDKSASFHVYISGSDSRESTIYNKSRSDMNMILTVNPTTKTILMTSIPRDYYVQLHGTTGLKDKLTHSGLYGVEMTKDTIEDLFDITIDYSVKVSMPAVVSIVDIVGGIDIESDSQIQVSSTKVIKKGMNHMDGEMALAYARTRVIYTGGDRHRVLNQQQVLKAVLQKALSDKTILLKYNEILDSLSNLYITDIPSELITFLVKQQLNDMSSWTFLSQSVDGTGDSLVTYTTPNSERYVMIPYDEDVKEASNKIKIEYEKTK